MREGDQAVRDHAEERAVRENRERRLHIGEDLHHSPDGQGERADR